MIVPLLVVLVVILVEVGKGGEGGGRPYKNINFPGLVLGLGQGGYSWGLSYEPIIF